MKIAQTSERYPMVFHMLTAPREFATTILACRAHTGETASYR